MQIKLDQNEFQQLNPVNLSVVKLCNWLITTPELIFLWIESMQTSDFNNLNFNADLNEILTNELKTTKTML